MALQNIEGWYFFKIWLRESPSGYLKCVKKLLKCKYRLSKRKKTGMPASPGLGEGINLFVMYFQRFN